MRRMEKLRNEQGKTIFFVSHSLPRVKEVCKTGMWIEGGRLMEFVDIDTVCDHYSDYVDKYNSMNDKDKKKLMEEKFEQRLITDRKTSFFDRLFSRQ